MNLKPNFALSYLIAAVAALLCVSAYVTRAQQDADSASSRMDAVQSNLAEQAYRVAYLMDRQEIWDTSKRYTRGVDRHDEELIRSTFWPDATISHGEPLSRDEFVDRWLKRLAGYASHQHHITGQTVEIDGDTAHVESYLIYFLVPRDTSADEVGPAAPGKPLLSEKAYLGSGRYIERWEKRNDEWRNVVREYVEDLALRGETVDYCGTRMCLGTWDRTDLSYVRPLQHLTPEQRHLRGENSTRQTSPLAGSASSESDGGSQWDE